jgi:Ser/Thr protein kinase RdoA (MazF antagonist)
VETAFARWETLDWTSLRHGVIHGDANDHNVLAERDRMTGLLDFGDMVHTAIVCELAVALAYAMLGERDPLAAAGAVIRGYHRHNPLTLPSSTRCMRWCACGWPRVFATPRTTRFATRTMRIRW